MAAVTLASIMAGLETRLATITGLNVTDTVPGQITPPYAYVGVPDIPNYRASFSRGSFIPNPTVTLYTSSKALGEDQLVLASFADVVGANSIPLAIESDRTLGGLGVDCTVTAFRTLGMDEVGAIGYYGGVFALQVIAAGS